MAWFTAFAIYFVIWWVTLFVVLPYGNRSQAEDGEIVQGTDPGAPTTSRIWQKLFWNSVVAAIVFGIYWGLTNWFDLSFSDIPAIIPENTNSAD